jgi:UDP-2-acetamido-2-deoxy-ribo-hexuluronate aminotransferase
VHYPLALHQQPAVLDPSARVPQSERAAREVLSLPMGPYLSERDQDAIVAALAGHR